MNFPKAIQCPRCKRTIRARFKMCRECYRMVAKQRRFVKQAAKFRKVER